MAINIPILTSFVDKGIKDAQGAFGGLTKSTMIAGAAIAGTVVAVAAFASKSIQKASDFNEAISKNTVIFGAISKEVENFAQTANRSLGISETAALKAAGTFAIFGKSAGLAGKELSDFSIEFVKLASDLASFNNTNVDEAINAIGSALRGEAEPLRKYGVLLDDATLKAAATELGIYSGSKALTAQQKVLAAQKVIFESTSDAQGDFSRTSTGLAAQQKILGATLENIQTNLGQAFLPIFLKAVKFFNDEVSPAFERVAEVIGEKGLVKGLQQALFEMGSFGPGMVNAFKQIAVTAAKAANVLYKFAVVTAATALFAMGQATKALGFLGKAFDDLIDVDALGASFDNFALGIKNMGSASDYSSFAAKQLAENAEAAAEAADKIILPAGGATQKLDQLKKAAKEAAETLAKETAAAIKTAADALDKRLNEALNTAKTNLIDAQTAFGNFGKSVSDSLTNAFSFKDAKDAGNETGGGFLKGLRDQAFKLQTYGYLITDLLRMGLSQEALQQVLNAGVDAGSAIAVELINAGSDAINETNDLVKATQTAADIIGMEAADKWYGAGVANAQSYLDGVQATFTYAQTRLAAPGLTIGDIASIGAGFDSGITGPSVTPITMRPEQGGGIVGGGMNITVNASLVSTPAQIGQDIIQAILHAQRRSGPVFAPAT